MTNDREHAVGVWVPEDALDAEMHPLPGRVALGRIPLEGPLPGGGAGVEMLVASFDLRFRLPEILARVPNLRVVQSLHAGVEPLLELVPPGVVVCSASGVHDIPVAEWVVGAILLSYKQFDGYRELQRRHVWDPTVDDIAQGRVPSVGPLDDLEDKTVLIVGHGSIGRAVEERLRPFGATVVGVASRARPDAHGVDALSALAPVADVVVVLAPGSDATRNLLDRAFLAQLRDGVLVVNAARGTVVDQVALAAECANGRLRAVLDVTDPEPLPNDHPLWSTPNVVITPHAAGSTPRWRSRAYRFVGDQIRRYVAGEELVNVRSNP